MPNGFITPIADRANWTEGNSSCFENCSRRESIMAHLPSEKLDIGDGGNPRISFRDKVLGQQGPSPQRECVDLIAKKLFTITHEKGKRLRPKYDLAPSVVEELRQPWKDAIIVKLLGKLAILP